MTRGLDLLQQAIDAMNTGRWSDAESAARAVLILRPSEPTALTILGGAAMNAGRYDEAISALKRAAAAQPKNPFIVFNLGESHRRNKALIDALPHFKKAIRLKSDFAEAHAQMGEALRALGRDTEATEAYQTALKHQPHSLVSLKGLGFLLQRVGVFSEAAAYFSRARALAPDPATKAILSANLGSALQQAGAQVDALQALSDAVATAPDSKVYWRMLAQALRHTRVIPPGPLFRRQLLALFEHEDVDPRALATAVLAILKDVEADIPALLNDPLLIALMTNTPVPDAGLEQILTAEREKLLRRVTDGVMIDGDPSFLCGLARQCFLNEYVFAVTKSEEDAVTQLIARINAPKKNGVDWASIAAIACYRRLDTTPARDVHFANAPESMRAVVRDQIEEPAQERLLTEQLVQLAPLVDETSRAVQRQYEEHPYPRWTRCQRDEPMPFRDAIRAMLPDLSEDEIPEIAVPRILIAGCGTGQETMHVVTTYKDAQVVGVDLSRVSLAYGARKLKEFGITSVRLVHGDILDLEKWPERFDLVESFGVLHHMGDPERGLRTVSAMVKPRGLLRIGLYSEIGRAAVVAARHLIAERGYASDAAGIRHLRAEIMTASGLPPALAALNNPASDFWTMSECRDLMFHVQEHRFTLLQIEAMLDRLNLEFLGLETRYATDRTRFSRMFPDPAALRSLKAWHAFEAQYPESFGETYQLWLRRP